MWSSQTNASPGGSVIDAAFGDCHWLPQWRNAPRPDVPKSAAGVPAEPKLDRDRIVEPPFRRTELYWRLRHW